MEPLGFVRFCLKLPLLQRNGGSWTESSKETNSILLDTHFPGSSCSEFPSIHSLPSNEVEFSYNLDYEVDTLLPGMNCSPSANSNIMSNKDYEFINNLVTDDKVIWAIKSFDPFKSIGLDGIIPKMLLEILGVIAPMLTKLYRKCLYLCVILTLWKQVKVVFIPKAGKTNHSKAKDYRPISLSSFMLKTFERLLDHHIRSKFNKNNISSSQHAYLKGKSCETALHEVVWKSSRLSNTINIRSLHFWTLREHLIMSLLRLLLNP